MMRIPACLAGGIVAVLCLTPAAAHHSYGSFDRCLSTTVEGVVDNVVWGNPHVTFTLTTDNAVVYRVEWQSLQQLEREAVSREGLMGGTRIVVIGSEHEDPDINVLTLIREIRRTDKYWSWIRTRPVAAAGACEESAG
jgi:hypothetical protein